MVNQEQNTKAKHESIQSYLVVTVGIGVILTACLHMVKMMGMTFITEAALYDLFLIWSGMLILSTYVLATTKKE
jgi:hypothetical protein